MPAGRAWEPPDAPDEGERGREEARSHEHGRRQAGAARASGRGSLPVGWIAVALWLLVASGVALFGAVYPWAYTPILASAAMLGLYGWMTADRAERGRIRPVVFGLLGVVAVPIVQLVPLRATWLAAISPATDTLLRAYDVEYGMNVNAGVVFTHPLSIAPAATWLGLAMLAALTLFLLGSTILLGRVRLGTLVRALVVLGLAIAVFGIVQRATFNRRIYWFWVPLNDPANVFGPFVNRNHFAGWMVMMASLTAGSLCAQLAGPGGGVRRNWRQRVAWLSTPEASWLLFTAFALGVMALSTVWTLSRSGIIALAVALVLVALRAAVRLTGVGRGIGIALLVPSVLFAVVWRGMGVVAGWYGNTSTFAWRVQLWRDTWSIIKDFRWFGTGLDTYGVSTMVYPMTDLGWHAAEAHSDYVQILSEGGILLTVAAIAAVSTLAWGIRRAFAQPQPPLAYWVRTGAAVGLVAIAVQELSDFSLQMPGNAVLFAVLAAIALHHPRRSRSATGPAAMRAAAPGAPDLGHHLP